MSDNLIAMLRETFHMFLFLATELTLLFLVISFIVGVINELLPANKIQKILSSRNGRGYFTGAILGSVTPFCSCSTIPMLTGLLKARAGFGPTMTFLFTSPLLNPVIIGLFLVTFGVKVTVIYAVVALTVAVIASVILEKLKFDRFIRSDVLQAGSSTGCGSKSTSCSNTADSSTCCDGNNTTASQNCNSAPTTNSCCDSTPTSQCCDNKPAASSCCTTTPPESRWMRVWRDTWAQFRKVLPWLMVGVVIGSFTYGFVPNELITRFAGPDNPLAVPVAAFIGIPLYIRAETMIPLAATLAAKGMSLGALMALIIGSAGASITEVFLLKSLFRGPMVAAFLLVIFSMAIIGGYSFSLLP
ncbi:permease [Kistimonas asteriae]|uniref:permease n=1 Tax=Kistimonas asteriae TaxID=517724 RepID=UPI001FE65844|nr:permease [Kistimonas asteriae]